MTQTIKEKKEFLQSYRSLRREACSKAEIIDHLRSMEMGRAIVYSDMPKAGSSQRDLSDYMAKADDIMREMDEANEKAVEQLARILRCIDAMEDAEEKEILRKRYIIGETWEQIAVDINRSWRHTCRRHGDALRHFEILA